MENKPLTVPTDLEIAELLSTGERQTPANVAAHLDHDSRYMSERLRNLEGRGYIRDAPPAERSGMYELTNRGAVAAFHIHTYVRDHHRMFHGSTEAILDNQPDDAFYPDLVMTSEPSRTALFKLDERDGLIVPSDLHIELVHESDMSPRGVGEILYGLYYDGLVERVDNMDVYRITERGEVAANLPIDVLTNPVELTDRLRETYTADETERLSILRTEMT